MSKFIYILLVALLAVPLAGCERGQAEQEPKASADAAPTVDVDALIEKLEAEEVGPDERLSAIHTARDEQVAEVVPALEGLLMSANPEIVVAAAAALNGLDANDAAGAVVEAAGRLGRERHYEQLRQLLFIVGDIGGPEARMYLEAVAQGHHLPAIRQTAGQVLERMN